MDSLIVSVSGVRGVVGRGLTPEVASSFAAALATSVEGRPVVLSRDGRPSGVLLRHAALAGLLAGGCKVHDLGVAATPTVGLAVRQLGAAGGLQITASHNPAEWNGLKLFGPDGRVLPAAEGERLKALFEGRQFRRATWDRLGHSSDCADAAAWHRDLVLSLTDVARIRESRPRVVLDANGGAGGPLGVSLLEALGAATIAVGAGADGHFAHEPEPIEANLRDVCPLVPDNRAAVGFVLDPDSDRLALIDETGRFIGEELTLALAVKQRLRETKGPIVINMSTSRVIEDLARASDVPCLRSAVGEANVADLMIQQRALIGGEGNGGVIDPRVGFVRDPFIGMSLVLSLLAAERRPLSAVVADLPSYHIVKDRYEIDRDRLPALLNALQSRWTGVAVDRVDGLRLDWSDRWVHVRSSNTEPIIRVIAEAPREEDARALCREVGMMIPG